MQYLYVDNFRGFSNTIIPIFNVNFLVGQNSTGKTSILGLLNLFQSQEFWLQQSFDSGDVQFGHFKDIVSVHSPDKNHFSVGFLEEGTRPGGKDKSQKTFPKGFLMTFKEKSGLPTLTKFTFNDDKTEYTITRPHNETNFYYKTLPSGLSLEKFIKTTFQSWRNNANIKSSIKLKKPKGFKFESEEDITPLVFFPIIFRDFMGSEKLKRTPGIRLFDVIPHFLKHLVWLAPIRTKPRRTYDELQLEFSPEGSHIPYLIRKILDSKTKAQSFKKKMKEIGKESGLFQNIKIHKFGKAPSSPFELDIIIDSKPLNIKNVGYGVSQSVPVIVEMLNRPEGSLFAVQQPEVHLHPKAQAALGQLIFDLSVLEKKSFLIETHSDFTIDRFRLKYRKNEKEKPRSQILFFERTKKQNRVTPIEIGKDGSLPPNQPSKYREFFIKEDYRLLDL